MNPASRRSFLSLAGAGAATAALAVAAPSAQAATPAAATAAAPPALPAKDVQNLVVHVKNARAGVLTVMVAGRDVEVTDHELVARLVHAANTALQG